MINRIGSGTDTGGIYERRGSRPRNPDTEAPSFLLGNEEQGVVWDRGKPEKKQKAARVEKLPEEVKVQDREVPHEPGFLRKLGERIKAFFSGFLRLVWYDKEEPEAEKDTSGRKEEAEAPAGSNEGKSRDELIRERIAAKDTDGMMDLLTEGNTKKPARNTSIYTSYDKKGRIVKQQEKRGRVYAYRKRV